MRIRSFCCGGGGIDGDKDYDGTLASLDFAGETLKVCVSACQDKEVSFRLGNVYTKGPDKVDTSEPITKKVLARNKKVANKLTQIYHSKGILPHVDHYDGHVKLFMEGKGVMGMLYLGEMESEQMRNTGFDRGILPFPSYSTSAEITTMVHDRAEVDTILNNASSFAMASAFLQYINEESGDILNTYYEEVLKFKYNDSKGARDLTDFFVLIVKRAEQMLAFAQPLFFVSVSFSFRKTRGEREEAEALAA